MKSTLDSRIIELRKKGIACRVVAENLGCSVSSVIRCMRRNGLNGQIHAKIGGKPGAVRLTAASALTDDDRLLLDGFKLEDAREHARKLCGEIRYSIPEVKPTVSAAVIRKLIIMVERLRASEELIE